MEITECLRQRKHLHIMYKQIITDLLGLLRYALISVFIIILLLLLL